MQATESKTILGVCPVCSHKWAVIHSFSGLGEEFLKIDFEIAFGKHVRSHHLRGGVYVERDTRPYHFNIGSLNEA